MHHYDRAQICENGHVITIYASSRPDERQNFCSRCGAPSIDECPQCAAAIHVDRLDARLAVLGLCPPPAFCPDCGTPYPWTAKALSAAKVLTNEVEGLTSEERRTLSISIEDLVSEGPQAEVAAIRFKRVVAKLGNEAGAAFREILVNVVSESIRRALWGT